MATHYFGLTPQDMLDHGVGQARYFYALRRTEEGDIYITKVDQLVGTDTVQVNYPGDATDDWEFFEMGVDFFDGRDADTHERPHSNLIFDQYRWDSRNISYYINENGELVARINQPYTYPTDV
jgi:hypothetical protein